MADQYGPRDWMLPSTAGAYQNRCWDCRELFIGYKRSQQCRACTPNPMPRVEERGESSAGTAGVREDGNG